MTLSESRPDIRFMVPGFSKCGTTMLCALLDEHPDICIPEQKELNFFTRDDYPNQWADYRRHFEQAGTARCLGEGSVSYSTFHQEKKVSARLRAEYPDLRLLFIARHPLKRLESSYREFHHSGVRYGLNAEFGLGRAMQQLPMMIEDTRYWQRLSCYRSVFPDSQIKVLLLEDLVRHPEQVLAECFAFIGVDPAPASRIELRKFNAGETKRHDSRWLRRLRTHPVWGFRIARLSPEQQDRWFVPLGLRPRFRDPVVIDQLAREIYETQIEGDARRLLDYCGKPADFWK